MSTKPRLLPKVLRVSKNQSSDRAHEFTFTGPSGPEKHHQQGEALTASNFRLIATVLGFEQKTESYMQGSDPIDLQHLTKRYKVTKDVNTYTWTSGSGHLRERRWGWSKEWTEQSHCARLPSACFLRGDGMWPVYVYLQASHYAQRDV